MILSINSGSSSIKFALFDTENELSRTLFGIIENIVITPATLSFHNTLTQEENTITSDASNHNDAVNFLIDWLAKQIGAGQITAIGHRIVHGMHHKQPELVTPDLLRYLKEIIVYDPEHLPSEIKLIELFAQQYPNVSQIACFDTGFHSTMPEIAKMLSIPRKYHAKGVQRYGFHGLSCAYLMQELEKLSGKNVVHARIILAHLGNGASLTAVKDGKSIDTSMGFTPSSGLVMGTRTGDLDPGAGAYLMEFERMSPKAYNHLINHESGLLGISETSADMRALLKIKEVDSRASDAIDLFCYQTKKWIGSFSAVLDGLDTLVFSGGIGEHSPEVRSKICNGLNYIGIELNELKNNNNEAIISTSASRVTIRVIKTNEEVMIAKLTYGITKK